MTEVCSIPLANRIFKDDDHLLIPSIREIDGEEQFMVVRIVGYKVFTGAFVRRGDLPFHLGEKEQQG